MKLRITKNNELQLNVLLLVTLILFTDILIMGYVKMNNKQTKTQYFSQPTGDNPNLRNGILFMAKVDKNEDTQKASRLRIIPNISELIHKDEALFQLEEKKLLGFINTNNRKVKALIKKSTTDKAKISKVLKNAMKVESDAPMEVSGITQSLQQIEDMPLADRAEGPKTGHSLPADLVKLGNKKQEDLQRLYDMQHHLKGFLTVEEESPLDYTLPEPETKSMAYSIYEPLVKTGKEKQKELLDFYEMQYRFKLLARVESDKPLEMEEWMTDEKCWCHELRKTEPFAEALSPADEE